MRLLKCVFLFLVSLCVFATLLVMYTSHSTHRLGPTDELDNLDDEGYEKEWQGQRSMPLHAASVGAGTEPSKPPSTAVSMQTQLPNQTDTQTDTYTGKKYVFSTADLHRHYAFTTDSPHDVLVFLHIQKTGGTTFGKNLVKNLDVQPPCKCGMRVKLKCPCFSSDGKQQWLFSRYSTGWMCGLHADITEWTECLTNGEADRVEGFHRKRRFLMFTVLREPTQRYISEYLHTNRGVTWSGATLRCDGESPTSTQLPSCYKEESWEGVLLPEFLDCPYNLANNRQTRMLANLSLVGCYEGLRRSESQELMLKSAKRNLLSLPYFSLKEFPSESQFLFEHTFNLHFKQPLAQLKPKTIHDSKEYFDNLKEEIQQRIISLNDLDIRLYNYAKQLFFARYDYVVKLRNSSIS